MRYCVSFHFISFRFDTLFQHEWREWGLEMQSGIDLSINMVQFQQHL